MSTAEALRDEGMQAAEDHADPRLILAVDAAIARHVASGMPFSANDIRDALPVVCSGLVGARVRAASMRRPVEMVAVGRTRSSLRSTHAKEIIVWRGVAA